MPIRESTWNTKGFMARPRPAEHDVEGLGRRAQGIHLEHETDAQQDHRVQQQRAAVVSANLEGRGLGAAVADVREHGSLPVPKHLVNASHRRMKTHGLGVGYRYPHDYEGGDVEQQQAADAVRKRLDYAVSEMFRQFPGE